MYRVNQILSCIDISSGYESDTENMTSASMLPTVRSQAERAVLSRSHAPPHRRRRDRTQFSASDLRRLESVFLVDRYPDIVLREELASDLSVSEDRIQVNRYTRSPLVHVIAAKLTQCMHTFKYRLKTHYFKHAFNVYLSYFYTTLYHACICYLTILIETNNVLL